MTHPHDQAPAPLTAEVVAMVAQLRQRAIFAKAENTGTAQGDAWHFDGAADMLTALAAENTTLRASEAAAMVRVKELEKALSGINALDDNAKCCSVGAPDGYDPPQCCGSPYYGLDRAKIIARAALTPTADKE